MNTIIAIDPGRKKCGLLLADLHEDVVLDAKVADQSAVIDLLLLWKSKGYLDEIILGNGTTSKYWQRKLKHIAPIEIVEERGSTLRARDRFWELWPPGIYLRWIPRGLLVPSQHLDAVAALVLLEDHCNKKLTWKGPRDFRIWTEQ